MKQQLEIDSFGLSTRSLETVFLKIGEMDEGKSKRIETDQDETGNVAETIRSSSTSISMDLSPLLLKNPFQLLLQQIYYIWWKKLLLTLYSIPVIVTE
ncbi:hypothetical protein COOONC_25152, partial [Cooperia oncophora]